MAALGPLLTVVPNHQLVLGVARCLAATHDRQDVSAVNHLDNSDARPKLPCEEFLERTALKHLETSLRTNCEVGLILVET